MPIYKYRHPETNEIVELIQSVHDKHEFFDEFGLKWFREFTIPQAATNTDISPFDQKAFTEKTGKMKGTWGDLERMSAEMSAKRAAKNNGIDPVKEKYFESQKKLTGLEHPEVKKRKAKEELAKKGVILE